MGYLSRFGDSPLFNGENMNNNLMDRHLASSPDKSSQTKEKHESKYTIPAQAHARCSSHPCADRNHRG
jgi:hypothetical protein